MITKILFVIFLILALWFWPVNILSPIYKEKVSIQNFLVAAVSLAYIICYFVFKL